MAYRCRRCRLKMDNKDNVVSFRNKKYYICEDCLHEFDEMQDEALVKVNTEFLSSLNIENKQTVFH